jgi:hypothetical protein
VSSFTTHALIHGRLADLRKGVYQTLLSAWVADSLALDAEGTHFGFVFAGSAILRCSSGVFSVSRGMYFAVPGRLRIAEGSGIVVSQRGYLGLFHLGGPVENQGRLRYIDGCTDSLLIPPVVHGDPCLNLLHLPPYTRQTTHTHPSLRVGLIIRGEGYCLTPAGRVALAPGMAFVIEADSLHSFHTNESPLLVLAYHPDSDCGPTHANHPMVNRTIIQESATNEA